MPFQRGRRGEHRCRGRDWTGRLYWSCGALRGGASLDNGMVSIEVSLKNQFCFWMCEEEENCLFLIIAQAQHYSLPHSGQAKDIFRPHRQIYIQ